MLLDAKATRRLNFSFGFALLPLLAFQAQEFFVAQVVHISQLILWSEILIGNHGNGNISACKDAVCKERNEDFNGGS